MSMGMPTPVDGASATPGEVVPQVSPAHAMTASRKKGAQHKHKTKAHKHSGHRTKKKG